MKKSALLPILILALYMLPISSSAKKYYKVDKSVADTINKYRKGPHDDVDFMYMSNDKDLGIFANQTHLRRLASGISNDTIFFAYDGGGFFPFGYALIMKPESALAFFCVPRTVEVTSPETEDAKNGAIATKILSLTLSEKPRFKDGQKLQGILEFETVPFTFHEKRDKGRPPGKEQEYLKNITIKCRVYFEVTP